MGAAAGGAVAAAAARRLVAARVAGVFAGSAPTRAAGGGAMRRSFGSDNVWDRGEGKAVQAGDVWHQLLRLAAAIAPIPTHASLRRPPGCGHGCGSRVRSALRAGRAQLGSAVCSKVQARAV